MAAKKLRKFPSFMIYLYSKESAFKAVKREGKICDRGTYTTCLWKVYKKAEVRNFNFKQRGTRFRIISMNVTLRKYMMVLVRCENLLPRTKIRRESCCIFFRCQQEKKCLTCQQVAYIILDSST